MTDRPTRRRLTVTTVLGAVAFLVFTVGVTVSLVQRGSFDRIFEDIVVRPSGPFGVRFIVQPLVAIIIAFLHGVADAKAGRQPYFWSAAHDKNTRWDELMEGLRAVANVLFLAIIFDTIYQLVVLKTFYWFETILVAALLAFVPYLIVRGPAARLARLFVQHEGAGPERGLK